MIKLTRLNGTQYWINPHQIELIECNPDVTLNMLSGKHYIEAIVAYRKRIGIFKNEI